MNQVKIQINVDQKEAIRQGKNTYGTQVITINPADLTPEQREILASCEIDYVSAERIPSVTRIVINGTIYSLPPVGEATGETAKFLLDSIPQTKIRIEREIEEKRARDAEEKKQRHENTIKEILAKSDEWMADNITGERDVKSPDYYRGFYIHREDKEIYTDPRLAEKMDRAIGFLAARTQERAARNAELQAEKAAAARLAEKEEGRKKAQIADFVAARGTASQKKRAALNLLPEDEIINEIRDEAYAPVSTFARYEKIQKSDVPCNCEEFDEPIIKFKANVLTEATAEDFDRMEQIQTILPAAKLTLRWHRGYCETCSDPEDDNDGVFERHSIMVALTVGEFDFTREFAV